MYQVWWQSSFFSELVSFERQHKSPVVHDKSLVLCPEFSEPGMSDAEGVAPGLGTEI
jgi:hypothetical protein